MGNQRNQPSPETIEDRLGRRIRFEREARGWTQTDLAKRLGELGVTLHASAIAKMEQRDVPSPRMIRLSEAEALAVVFGIPFADLAAARDSAEGRLQRAARALGDPVADTRVGIDEVVNATANYLQGTQGEDDRATMQQIDGALQPMQRIWEDLQRLSRQAEEVVVALRERRQRAEKAVLKRRDAR